MPQPLVSIIIPTRNGAETLKNVLPAIFNQNCSHPFEVIMVDSESSDGTPNLAREFNVRYLRIQKKDFNHGATRQWAAEQTKGELVVFLTQDATPANENWLSSLVTALEIERNVVGAYSRQVPYEGCHPLDAERILEWFGPIRRIQSLDGMDWERLTPMKRRTIANFDDVSSCVKKEILMQFPYHSEPYGEDFEWARRVLRKGMSLVYEPSSVVYHSHRKSPLYEFRRRYIEHKMLRAYHDIQLIRNWKEVQAGIFHEWKQNYQLVKKCPKTWFEKWTLFSERVIVTVAQALGMYLGAHSSQYEGPVTLNRFERWLIRSV